MVAKWDAVAKQNVELEDGAAEQERDHRENLVDVPHKFARLAQIVLSQEPPNANERGWHFKEQEGYSNRHNGVLLPESCEVVEWCKKVMNQLLLVQFVLDSLDNHYVKEVDQEVGGCEKGDPHVCISWGI